MGLDPTDGFEKLQHLLATGSAPQMTFPNLILLYLKFEYFSLAADTMAENTDLANKHMDGYLHDFVQARVEIFFLKIFKAKKYIFDIFKILRQSLENRLKKSLKLKKNRCFNQNFVQHFEI